MKTDLITVFTFFMLRVSSFSGHPPCSPSSYGRYVADQPRSMRLPWSGAILLAGE